MSQKTKKILGQKILDAWKIDTVEITPEIEEEYRQIKKEFARGMAKKQAEREKKRREADRKLRDFLITY